MVEKCWYCAEEDERLYCPECRTISATCCVNCGYCSECQQIKKVMDFHDYKGRE